MAMIRLSLWSIEAILATREASEQSSTQHPRLPSRKKSYKTTTTRSCRASCTLRSTRDRSGVRSPSRGSKRMSGSTTARYQRLILTIFSSGIRLTQGNSFFPSSEQGITARIFLSVEIEKLVGLKCVSAAMETCVALYKSQMPKMASNRHPSLKDNTRITIHSMTFREYSSRNSL